jgi:hypothetical protein
VNAIHQNLKRLHDRQLLRTTGLQRARVASIGLQQRQRG